MRALNLTTDPRVPTVFANYPLTVRPQMEALRALVLETAASMPELTELEETLKWGEPSYIAKKGSTLRMDWKAKKPDQYALYFKCTSLLVPTFKEVFGEVFKYEKNRAIVFALEEELPVEPLKACIKATLSYHLVKGLPRLGM
ncbi:MAG: DUF1801 domain-containing protein [Bacteroidota bacterium]